MAKAEQEEIDKTLPSGRTVNCSACGARRFTGYGPCECGHYEQRKAVFIARDIKTKLREVTRLSQQLEDAIAREEPPRCRTR